jgi:hypothetical protein
MCVYEARHDIFASQINIVWRQCIKGSVPLEHLHNAASAGIDGNGYVVQPCLLSGIEQRRGMYGELFSHCYAVLIPSSQS